jgi:predicted SAM-dependent methyltransferase
MVQKKRTAPTKAQQKQQQLQAFKQAVQRNKPFAYPQDGKKIVLSLGLRSARAGGAYKYFAKDGWTEIRIDAYADMKPDAVHSLTHLPMIEDNSLDAVWLGHLLHRLSFKDGRAVLAEVMRGLKHEGVIVASVPDIQVAATYAAHGELEKTVYSAPVGDISALDMIYGYQKAINAGDASCHHLSGFTAETFGLFLREAGISNLQMQQRGHDVYASGKKLPYEHPERVERIVMQREGAATKPAAPDMPASAPAQVVRYIDNLEDAPQQWKPLNLNAKKKKA